MSQCHLFIIIIIILVKDNKKNKSNEHELFSTVVSLSFFAYPIAHRQRFQPINTRLAQREWSMVVFNSHLSQGE